MLGTLAFAASAHAAEEGGDIDDVLNQNVVTGASRAAETSADAPAVSTTITASDMRRYGIRSIDEAINFLGLGMFAQDPGHHAEVGARGVGFTLDFNHHVLVLVDGMPANEQFLGGTFFGKTFGLPLDQIDHVEVILGPGSVLYGSQAMLGVINVVTKSGKDWRGVHATLDVGISPPENSRNEPYWPNGTTLGTSTRLGVGAGTTFELFGREAALTFGADYVDVGLPSYTFPLQKPVPPASSKVNYGPIEVGNTWGGRVDRANYRKVVGAYSRLTVGGLSASVRASSTRTSQPYLDQFFGGNFDEPRSNMAFTTAAVDLRYDHVWSERLSSTVRAYGSIAEFRRTTYATSHPPCPDGPTGPCNRLLMGDSNWVGAELQSTWDWLGDGAYSTMWGVDGRVRNVSGAIEDVDLQTGRSFGSHGHVNRWEQALGVYVQQRAKPFRWGAINAGVRADFDSVSPKPSLFHGISPRLALVASPTDTFNLRAIFSSAFRSPSAAELHLEGGSLVAPASLRSESVTSYELVADKRFGAHKLMIGGFYSAWKDMIEIAIAGVGASGAMLHYVNTGEILNYGGNVAYEGAALDAKLRFGVNLTVARADKKIGAAEQPVTQAPTVFGNARVSYSLDGDLPTFALGASLMGPRYADMAYFNGEETNLGRPRAPTQVDLRATISGPVPGAKGVSYRVGADYVVGKWLPYVAGPNQGAPISVISAPTTPALVPSNRFTLFATLQMDVTP